MTLQRQLSIWLIALFAFILLLWILSPILLPFLAGMVLAYFLDPVSGARKGGFRAGGAVQAVAAGSGSSVLLGSRDGFLYAVSLETGEGGDR